MIKNNLYPYIAEYINKYLHGFTKEQMDIAIIKGELGLEKLNLRPDTINKTMDESNIPFWLKAGLINKIHVGVSLMNIIGEKPLEVLIEGMSVMLGPSYKWITKNIIEYLKHSNKGSYSKIKDTLNFFNVKEKEKNKKNQNDFDKSIFNQKKVEKIFKDNTIFSEIINSLFEKCFKFYYMINFTANIKIKNLHIRFEDDELLNFTGNMALGLKIDEINIKLGCDGLMKKDSIKISALDVYWEAPAKVLISSDFLNNSIMDEKLSDNYYKNLKNVDFSNFSYQPNTKLIIENFNLKINIGTKIAKEEEIDIFKSKGKNCSMFVQIATSSLTINVIPDILEVANNFTSFTGQFSTIEKMQEYKPSGFKNVSNFGNIQLNKENAKEWIKYCYLFYKQKKLEQIKETNILNKEFLRFYNITINKADAFKNEKNEEKEEKQKEEKNEQINPDNIYLSVDLKILFNSININLYPSLKTKNKNHVCVCLGNIETKIDIKPEIFDLAFNIRTIDIGPSKLNNTERVQFLPGGCRKVKQNQNLKSPLKSKFITVANTEDQPVIKKLVKKYNPNYEQKVQIIEKALDNAEYNKKLTDRKNNREFGGQLKYDNNLIAGKTPIPEYEQPVLKSKGNSTCNPFTNTSKSNVYPTYSPSKQINIGNSISSLRQKKVLQNDDIQLNNNFAQSVLSNYEMPILQQKIEEKKQVNEISISKAVNDYNFNKNHEKNTISRLTSITRLSNLNFNPNEIKNGKLKAKNRKNLKSNSPKRNNLRNSLNSSAEFLQLLNYSDINKDSPINLIELYSNSQVGALSFKFSKPNNKVSIDSVSIQLGTIRINLYSNYVIDCIDVVTDYQQEINKPIIKRVVEGSISGITLQKELNKMKEYIINYISKIPEKQKTASMKSYLAILKNDLAKYRNFVKDPTNFEFNYLFSFFPKGIDFHFDFENFECVYFNNENKTLGKCMMPAPEFEISLTLNKIYLKCLQLELEMNDLENSKNFLNQLKQILEQKLKIDKIILEPCFVELKSKISNYSSNNFSYNKEKYNNNFKNNNYKGTEVKFNNNLNSYNHYQEPYNNFKSYNKVTKAKKDYPEDNII